MLHVIAVVALTLSAPTFADTMTITALWDYARPDQSEARFHAALADARGDWRLELLTQVARTHSLRHAFDRAHQLLDDIEPQLREAGNRPRVRYLLERGRTFNSAGDRAAARPLFLQAWERAAAAGESALAIDAAHMIAIVDGGAAGIEWNRRALVLARAASDPEAQRWQGSLLNNIGYELKQLGRFDEALEIFRQAQSFRAQHGTVAQQRVAAWMVGHTLRLMGRHDEALAIQLQLERDGAAAGEPDGYVFEEIAELHEAAGRTADAAPYFQRALRELERDAAFVRNEPARLARLRAHGR